MAPGDAVTLRDELQPVVDDGRQLAADLGLRPRALIVRSRVWSGGRLGTGTATDTDLTISPPPKMREPPARWVADAPGRYESGDVLVEKISRTYAESTFTAPTTLGHEMLLLIDGREYTMVGVPEIKTFGWSLQLRRRTRV